MSSFTHTPKYLVNQYYRGFRQSVSQVEDSYVSAPRIEEGCILNIDTVTQVSDALEDIWGFDYDDKKWKTRSWSSTYSYSDSNITETGAESYDEDYADGRTQRVERTNWVKSGSKTKAANESTIDCSGTPTDVTDTFSFTTDWQKLTFEGSDVEGLWQLRETMNYEDCSGITTIYEFRTPLSTDGGDGAFTYSNEITWADVGLLRDETHLINKARWVGVERDLWVRSNENWAKIDRDYVVSGATIDDSSTGTFATIGTVALDSTQLTADKAAAVALASFEISTLDDEIDAIEESINGDPGDPNDLGYVGEAQDLEDAAADAVTDYTQDKSDWEDESDDIQSARINLANYKNQLLDTEGLTAGEIAAIEASRDAAQSALDALLPASAKPAPAYPFDADTSSPDEQIRIAEDNIDQKDSEKDYWTARSTALNAGDPYPKTIISNSNQTIIAESEEGTARRVGRYRFQFVVPDHYDVTESATVTLKWQEKITRTEPPETEGGDPVVTYEYTAKTADIVVTATGLNKTDWFDVDEPSYDNATVSLVSPSELLEVVPVYSKRTYSKTHKSGKVGIHSYVTTSPPTIYAEESFTGGFDGCTQDFEGDDIVTPARSYVCSRGRLHTSPDANRVNVYAALSGRMQPSYGDIYAIETVERNAGYPFYESQTSTTRTYFERSWMCGGVEVEDNLYGSLSGEITTADITAEVNGNITRYLDWLDDKIDDLSPANPVVEDDYPTPMDWDVDEGYKGVSETHEIMSFRKLSDDEIDYGRSVATLLLSNSRGLDSSTVYTWDKKTLNLITGVITTVAQTGTASTDGSNVDTDVRIDLDAAEGTMEWITNLKQDIVDNVTDSTIYYSIAPTPAP